MRVLLAEDEPQMAAVAVKALRDRARTRETGALA